MLSESKHYADIYNILGFVDENSDLENEKVNGYPVLGNTEWLLNYSNDICAVICIGNAKIRKRVFDKLKTNTLINYPEIIADDVRHSKHINFGRGCIICSSNTLTVNVTIGEFAIVNLDCTIGHDAVLGDFVTLYPSVNVSGDAYIHSGVEIGTGAAVIQGKTIGENAIIGAGSVVVKDIPPNCTAVGVPAEAIKYHNK